MISTQILADKIVYFKNCLLPDDNWIDYIESNLSEWKPWIKETHDGGSVYQKKYGYKKILNGMIDPDYHMTKLNFVLKECTAIYKYLYNVSLDRERNSKIYVITKYDAGEPIYDKVDLQEHVDIMGSYEEYSYVIYFNDNYDEGEIEFPNFNLKIKPESGSIIMFPSGDPYAHIAHKSKNGTKYFISHFWKAGAGAGYEGSY